MDFARLIQRIGRNVRKARWRAGMTQENAATTAGVTVRVLAELERGNGNPTARTLFLLSEALRCSVADLTTTGRDEALPATVRAPARGRKPKPRRFPKRLGRV